MQSTNSDAISYMSQIKALNYDSLAISSWITVHNSWNASKLEILVINPSY